MTLKSSENLIRICKYMSQPGSRLSRAMVAAGGSEKSHHIFALMNDDSLLVNWPDPNEYITFAEALETAKEIKMIYWYHQLTAEVAEGTQEAVVFNGEQQWQKDPEILGELGPNPSAIDCYVFFGQHDPYLRRKNARGQMELVPLTVTRAAGAHLKIHIARSIFPELNPIDRSESTDTNRNFTSMLIVGRGQLDKLESEMSPAELKAYLQRRLRELDDTRPTAPVVQQIEPPVDAEFEEVVPEPPRPRERGRPPGVDINQKPDEKRGYRVC